MSSIGDSRTLHGKQTVVVRANDFFTMEPLSVTLSYQFLNQNHYIDRSTTWKYIVNNRDKYKPAASKTILLLLAGGFWLAVSSMLLFFAVSWLNETENINPYIYAFPGVILSLFVYYFGFRKIAEKNIARILPADEKMCVFAFMPWKSYLIIPIMITIGAILRHSALPRQYLAILYTGIGLAMLLSSMKYLRIILNKSAVIGLLIIGVGSISTCCTATASENSGNKSNRPNIIFIMADDHAAHAIGAYGGKLCKTPNIDKLAKEGMRFTNCFNVNSLCAPSRAALITGRYNHHNGFKWNGNKFDGSQVTFPKLLQKAGYETALIGKWHLRTDPTGFDYYSIIPGQGRFFNCAFKDTKESPDKFTATKGYLTDVITDKSIKWLKERDNSKPFCLLVHHKAPHEPHHYPDKYKDLYADLPEPTSFNADYSKRGPALDESRAQWSKLDNIIPNHFNKTVPPTLKRKTQEYKDWSYQCFFKGYLRLVAALDDNVGRLLDYIDKSGLSENTIVIYTSDNGFFLGDYGLFNKMWMYEESLRLPLIVRHPGKIKPGTVNNDLISILDFAPTFLDYAESKSPEILQGRSIRNIFEGEIPEDWRKVHYYHYYGQYDVPAHYGVRTATHKLLLNYKMDSWELYDLEKDPRELQNIYTDPEQTEIIKQLKSTLKKMRRKYEDVDK